jgi:hypothetical protein
MTAPQRRDGARTVTGGKRFAAAASTSPDENGAKDHKMGTAK